MPVYSSLFRSTWLPLTCMVTFSLFSLFTQPCPSEQVNSIRVSFKDESLIIDVMLSVRKIMEELFHP